MFHSGSTGSLNARSLNDFNIRPKRTSYDAMSTWIFSDNKPGKFPEDESLEKSVPELANCPSYFKHPISLDGKKDITLPVIKRAKSVRVLNDTPPFNISPYEQSFKQKPNDFLMTNWADKRVNNNRVHSSLDPNDQSYRKGRQGQWGNIDMAFRENANKFLFVKGPRETINNDYNAEVALNPKKLTDSSEYKNSLYGRNISEALLKKLNGEKIDMQQRYGIEFGNWNIMR